MTNQEQLAFKALADPTRRQILLHLSHGEKTIGELVSEFSMTRAAVKKHLDVLNKGQMVAVQARGRERINRLKPDGIKSVTDWLNYFDQFWDHKLAALKNVIESDLPTTSNSECSISETLNTVNSGGNSVNSGGKTAQSGTTKRKKSRSARSTKRKPV